MTTHWTSSPAADSIDTLTCDAYTVTWDKSGNPDDCGHPSSLDNLLSSTPKVRPLHLPPNCLVLHAVAEAESLRHHESRTRLPSLAFGTLHILNNHHLSLC